MEHKPPSEPVGNRRLEKSPGDFKAAEEQMHPFLGHVHDRHWCWRCLQIRRFRYRSWSHAPTPLNNAEYGSAWWEDDRGHRR